MGKDLQTLNGQNKLALWAGRISECRNSGQNVKAWCRENGVCEQNYYKWQKRLFEMAQLGSVCGSNTGSSFTLRQCSCDSPDLRCGS